jgi:hypothetical protein
MFRIITDFQPQPSLFLLCDTVTCGHSMVATVSQGYDPTQAAGDFVKAAMSLGWAVGLDGQLCPDHVAKARGTRNLVQLVTVGAN